MPQSREGLGQGGGEAVPGMAIEPVIKTFGLFGCGEALRDGSSKRPNLRCGPLFGQFCGPRRGCLGSQPPQPIVYCLAVVVRRCNAGQCRHGLRDPALMLQGGCRGLRGP